jgi:outer membrane lipoprotein-sorting protein
MTVRKLTAITTVAVGLLAAPAAFAADAVELLKQMDVTMNRWKDQYFEYEMRDTQPGKGERTLGLNVYMKGEKRVTEFTSPADARGTRVLILSDTQMYVYLPAYKKVRRVASHVTAQGFMGTAYSQDDLAVTTFSDKYDAKTLQEAEGKATLELKVKDGLHVAYPKIQVTIDVEKKLPVAFSYFDDKGTKLKTESRGEYKCEGDICVPYEMKMEDHTTPGHVTHLSTKKWKVNSDLEERIFSRRYIQKGR